MTAAGRPQRDGLSIGAVLAQLRPEFPDVTISKIRFLESEGLVCPGRTSSGYRQFAPADVERLKFVLAAQRDRYLPLKVIKEQLDAADEGRWPGAPRLVSTLAAPEGTGRAPRASAVLDELRSAGPDIRMTKEEFLREVGIDNATLAELEQYGLVKPGAAGFYNPDAVLVARTVKTMTEFGIEPRHLRAFRASADREVGLLEQIVTPLQRQHDPDARARAEEVVRELAALSVTLHTLLVKAGLRAVTGG